MISRSATRRTILPPQQHRRSRVRRAPAIDHAVRIIHHVCCLAGCADLLNEIRNPSGGPDIKIAIGRHDTAALFDWLVEALSYQGISDQVVEAYMAEHGYVAWADVRRKFSRDATCPKLKSYWHYHDCRYDKVSRTCAEPDHLERCPVASHDLRNGRLNQMAYSLYLFISDICDGDLVGWIDRRLKAADDPSAQDRLPVLQAALVGPLREVYGLSDKVLTMTLSSLLLAAPEDWPTWIEVGGSMIAVDTLVHNFLHRTGILVRFDAEHAYGAACYRPGGCASIIAAVSARIDARRFNPVFPKDFPRFVQHATWRYCSQNGLDVCNGNRIDDRQSCQNVYCQIYSICDRERLNNDVKS